MRFTLLLFFFIFSFDICLASKVEPDDSSVSPSPRTRLRSVGTRGLSVGDMRARDKVSHVTTNPLFGKSLPVRRHSMVEGGVSNDEVVCINPVYGRKIPPTAAERKFIKALSTDPLFVDTSQACGLRLENIHKRCLLRRQHGGDGGDFSNLVGMVRGTIFKTRRAEDLLFELLQEKIKSEEDLRLIIEQQTFIPIYKGSIERSLESISEATGVSIAQLRLLPPLE